MSMSAQMKGLGGAPRSSGAMRREDQLLMELQQRKSADATIVGHVAQAFTLIRILEERLTEQDAGATSAMLAAARSTSPPTQHQQASHPIWQENAVSGMIPEAQEAEEELQRQHREIKAREAELEMEQQLLLQQQRAYQMSTQRPQTPREAPRNQQSVRADASVEEVLRLARQKNADLRNVVGNRPPEQHPQSGAGVSNMAIMGEDKRRKFLDMLDQQVRSGMGAAF